METLETRLNSQGVVVFYIIMYDISMVRPCLKTSLQNFWLKTPHPSVSEGTLQKKCGFL